MFFTLPNLLHLRGVRFKFALIGQGRGQDGHAAQLAGVALAEDKSRLVRVSDRVSVLQPPEKQQRVIAWTPFMVIPSQENWFLRLLGAQPPMGQGWIMVLRNVAGFEVVVDGLKIDAVRRADLLFELGGDRQLFEVFVRTLAGVRSEQSVQRIGRIAERPKLRSSLDLASAAQVFRAGTEPHPISFQQPRILLLGNLLRQRAAAHRREQVRH